MKKTFFPKNIKILITGGAGYIGSNLISAILKNSDNPRITSIDNYTSGKLKNHHPGVEYINLSTEKIFELNSFDFDYIYHFGEYSRVENSFTFINDIFESNLVGTSKVLNFWTRTNAKLIYSGSSTKFAKYTPEDRETPYAISKRINSELVKGFGHSLNKHFSIVYFYNVFGKNENYSDKYGTVISRFLKLKMEGKILPVNLPGTQKRNFTYIDDTINGILLASRDGNGDGYGIGNDKSYTILDLAKLFESEIKYCPEQSGNRESALIVNEKLKNLGWSTSMDLEEYIKFLKKNEWVRDERF